MELSVKKKQVLEISVKSWNTNRYWNVQ